MAEKLHKVLFYITLSYSFPILRPIEEALKKRGHTVVWHLSEGKEVAQFLRPDDIYLKTAQEVIDYNADATLLPGNKAPLYTTGIKVQLLHGLNAGKKDEFKVRGYFDLYCTQGPASTQEFEKSRIKSPTFDIRETGWPKLDPLFTPHPDTKQFQSSRKTILYAPTFSPKLTSTYLLFDEIKRLSVEQNWNWIVKFHPKATQEEVDMYHAIENEHFNVVSTENIIPLLQAADILLSDTSSILSEFALLKKPVVSYKNRRPQAWMINFSNSEELERKILQSFSLSGEQQKALDDNMNSIHPYNDGQSGERVADAVEEMLLSGTGHLKKKPSNWFRTLKNKMKGTM